MYLCQWQSETTPIGSIDLEKSTKNVKRKMINARQEFEEFIKGVKAPVLCATVLRSVDPMSAKGLQYDLTQEGSLEKFLESIDFDYDNGFCSQVLFGLIWFDDGSWADRIEYDGQEEWRHQLRPIIPACLRFTPDLPIASEQFNFEVYLG